MISEGREDLLVVAGAHRSILVHPQDLSTGKCLSEHLFELLRTDTGSREITSAAAPAKSLVSGHCISAVVTDEHTPCKLSAPECTAVMKRHADRAVRT